MNPEACTCLYMYNYRDLKFILLWYFTFSLHPIHVNCTSFIFWSHFSFIFLHLCWQFLLVFFWTNYCFRWIGFSKLGSLRNLKKFQCVNWEEGYFLKKKITLKVNFLLSLWWTWLIERFLYHDLTNSRNVDCMPMGVCEICILILLTLKKITLFYCFWGFLWNLYSFMI